MRHSIDPHEVERRLARALDRNSASARDRLHVEPHGDSMDEAQWSEDAAVAIEELDIARRRQREASLALARLRDEQYGICADCNREIGEARLDAVPWAVRCVRCERLRELRKPHGDAGPSSLRDWMDAPGAA